ncbi:MAG: threonine synthase [Pseudomonadota bacterium]
MKLFSTKDNSIRHRWSDGVLRGLAPDGGLYLPAELPHLSGATLAQLADLSFPHLAYELARRFLSEEVPDAALKDICSSAFTFDVPLRQISERTHILELFHGPTCAFKDFGARFMARLFRYFLGTPDRPLTVLVATSGDTGSAVANAFYDSSESPPIRVVILFPKGKVSLVQEKQMTTLGYNVTTYEVDGTFDDCQSLVKQALADQDLTSYHALTSANSINIARLLPQMFYYVYASLKITPLGAPIFSVPSGNLGNLTGGIIGHLMGMPASHFIAACNINAPFPEYLRSGAYLPHRSQETVSNAMDVGNPSNYDRLLSLYGNELSTMRASISGDRVTDDDTVATIGRTYRDTGYTLDPHTAVGVLALDRYLSSSRSTHPGVVLATAHPAKFSSTVSHAIGRDPEIPTQLAEALIREGHKIPLENSYAALKHQLHTTE